MTEEGRKNVISLLVAGLNTMLAAGLLAFMNELKDGKVPIPAEYAWAAPIIVAMGLALVGILTATSPQTKPRS